MPSRPNERVRLGTAPSCPTTISGPILRRACSTVCRRCSVRHRDMRLISCVIAVSAGCSNQRDARTRSTPIASSTSMIATASSGWPAMARHGARSPTANSRLSLDSSGRVVLSLKRSLRDVPARIEVVMEVRLGHVHPGHASRAAARSSTRS